MAITILSTQNLTAGSATVSVSDTPSGTFNASRLTVADTTPGITGGQVTITEGGNTETKRIISVTNGTQFVLELLANAYTTAAIVTFLGFTNPGDPKGQATVSGATGLKLNGSKNRAENFFNIYANDLRTLWQKVVDKTDGKLTSADLELKTDATSGGDRGLKMWLTGSTWIRFLWDNAAGKFKLTDQTGTLQKLQVADPAASGDAATKNYVDTTVSALTLPKRYFYSGKPTRTGNSTCTVTDVDCLDHGETFRILKTGTLTLDLTTLGTGGLLSSQVSDALPGTISVSNGSPTVTGTSTQFNDPVNGYKPGDTITTNGNQIRMVNSVSSNTSLTVSTNFSTNESGVAHKRNAATVTGSARLNLYVLSAGKANATFLGASPRNVAKGDTMVDLPVVTKTGTVSISNGSTTVTGSGTSFSSELEVGWTIRVNGEVRTITNIASNTSLSVDQAFTTTGSGLVIALYYKYYRMLPFGIPILSSGNLAKWNISGWPNAPYVSYPDYDGTSSYFIASTNLTSEQTKNLWNLANLSLIPSMAGRFPASLFFSKTGGSVPANVSGIVAGVTGSSLSSGTLQEFTTTGPTFNYIQGRSFLDQDLDASGTLYYKSGDTNLTVGIDTKGYYVTEWK